MQNTLHSCQRRPVVVLPTDTTKPVNRPNPARVRTHNTKRLKYKVGRCGLRIRAPGAKEHYSMQPAPCTLAVVEGKKRAGFAAHGVGAGMI
jgi:hypothetical protein